MNPDNNQTPSNQGWQGNQLPPSSPPPPLPTPAVPPYDPWAEQPGGVPSGYSQPTQPAAGYQPAPPVPGPLPNMPASNVPEWQQNLQTTPPPPPMPAPAPLPPTEPQATSYTSTYEPEPVTRRWPKYVIALLFILLVSGVLYTGYQTFFVSNDKKPDTSDTRPNPSPSPEPPPTPEPPPPPAAVDLATLNSVALQAPADMAGYTAHDLGIATVKDYTDPSGKCNLQFGTLNADQLPGNNINELLAPQLTAFRAAGATITGPTQSAALELKDASTNATYTMLTMTVSFVNGSRQGTSHYSAAILKNGTRAFISRSCITTSGPIDAAALDAVDAKARQITAAKQ